MADLSAFSERYTEALEDFLVRSDEGARMHAYEMGRQALTAGIGLLDLTAVHHGALVALSKAHPEQSADPTWLGKAGEFLAESQGHYEMSHRGYREANQELRHLNGVLTQKNEEISRANHELESFSYSVAHDLRAPLRAIRGFSTILQRDHGDRLDEDAQRCVSQVLESALRMGSLVDSMLNLARFSRADMHCQLVDLAQLAREVMARIRQGHPERPFDFIVPESLPAAGDSSLLTAVLENLLGNAWKYSQRRDRVVIELGLQADLEAFFVRDNGAGFNMAYAGRLFQVFQRLHSAADFEGTGVGLAIVHRIIERHGGRVWAESQVEQGATFYFTLPKRCPE